MDNSSVPNEVGSNEAYPYLLLYTLVVGLVLLSGVLGNLGIIIVTVCTKALRSLTGTLVLNLAVVDLFVMITVLPFIILVNLQGDWRHGYVLCYAVGFAETSFTTSSLLSMALISYDRYTAIVKPDYYDDLRARFIKRAGISVLAVWILGFFNAAIPIIDGSGYSFNEVTGTCTVNWPTISFTATCIIETIRFFIPFTIFTLSYSKIFHMAKRARRKINPGTDIKNLPRSNDSNTSEDTYLTNTNSPNPHDNQSAGLASSVSNTSSSAYSASIKDNIQSVQSKGESRPGQRGGKVTTHQELLLRVNDIGKTVQSNPVSTGTQQDLPYSMASALSHVSQRPEASQNPWQRAVAKKFIKRKVFRSMVLLYGSFLFSWIPYILWTFWTHFLKDPSTILATRVIFIIAISNSLFNVYLYGFVKSTYRKALKGCLKKRLSFKRGSQNYYHAGSKGRRFNSQ